MENRILGIHHITAIAGNAKRNFDFYTKVLGLRLVKKTVNFDDPGTYHFYFGDEVGTPGTILTFFPWDRVKQGRAGAGMATDVAFSVPAGSLEFWKDRFEQQNVGITATGVRFGDPFISFVDPDGLALTLIVPKTDDRKGWSAGEVNDLVAIKGFHSTTLTLRSKTATAKVLTDVLGYYLSEEEGSTTRYKTDAVATASIVDIIETHEAPDSINAGGTIHHVAFRVKDEETLMAYRKKVQAHGLQITEKIDRNYFFSLYFREPGGVLFEIATDSPGFAVDEAVDQLGSNLKLPPQYESYREKIEEALPVLD
ncbi:MAG TPA: ring-cleaving dioxygenase [Chryseosolibacter sp.]|nr:ring-cleaving dioxygenase [Chryseosolibacter sp.]